MERSCGDCEHWDGAAKDKTAFCHCRAPAPFVGKTKRGHIVADRLFPLTGATDWCSEWKKKGAGK